MSVQVAITGMGIISSIGDNVQENWQSLLHEKHGISLLKNINSIHRNKLLAGEIKKSNADLISELKLPEDNNYTRTSLLAIKAVTEALIDADITDINTLKTGLISSTSVGGMDLNEQFYYTYFKNSSLHKYIDTNHAGDSTKKIADYIGLKGLITTISTACSSAANAMIMGANLIKSGKLDRAIVGGTDALSMFTINGFNTLMIYSDELNKPFDNDRKGLNLGEAAAYLVLENAEIAKENNHKIYGYLSGYGNANDAFHQTASSETGEGAFLAIQKAIKTSGIKAEDIDYINVHGTATPNNDLSEGTALQRIFKTHIPDFSSTKPWTGHTLAAAAAVEAVFCLLALKHQVIYPNLNFNTPMNEFEFKPNLTQKSKPINHILSNSFGFGGNCSAVIFSK